MGYSLKEKLDMKLQPTYIGSYSQKRNADAGIGKTITIVPNGNYCFHKYL